MQLNINQEFVIKIAYRLSEANLLVTSTAAFKDYDVFKKVIDIISECLDEADREKNAVVQKIFDEKGKSHGY